MRLGRIHGLLLGKSLLAMAGKHVRGLRIRQSIARVRHTVLRMHGVLHLHLSGLAVERLLHILAAHVGWVHWGKGRRRYETALGGHTIATTVGRLLLVLLRSPIGAHGPGVGLGVHSLVAGTAWPHAGRDSVSEGSLGHGSFLRLLASRLCSHLLLIIRVLEFVLRRL